MTDELPRPVLNTLLAISQGTVFGSYDDGHMEVKTVYGTVQSVPAEHLDALQARALITFGDDDPARNMPRTLTVTAWGQTFLRRYMLANGLVAVVRKRSSPNG